MKGRFFKTFNSPEASAFSLVVYALRGVSLFSFEPVLDSLSLIDVSQRLVDHFDARYSASCIIENRV